jgi:hypothetical protein
LRVKNETGHGVFVANHGVVPAGEEATVRESEAVKQLLKDGALTKAKSSDTEAKDGDAA